MYYSNTQLCVDKPVAFITVNKRRIKQFDSNVYLNDQTEFEIELYNPTNEKVLAEIELNGIKISNAGVEIKPGQRVFLERFIDENRKFKFETYEVSDTKQNQKAIAYNGNVKVYFYKVYKPQQFNNVTWTNLNNVNYCNTITTGSPITFSTNNLNTNFTGTATSASAYVSGQPWDGTVTCNFSDTLSTTISDTKTITGTVEKGEVSSQNFMQSNEKYQYSYSWISFWKILPMEQKPIQAKDLAKHCTNCGTKIKSTTWKFCPGCGSEVEKDFDLNQLSKEELIKLLQSK